jgi:sugar phosphate isomerase/epimerase
MAQHPLSRRSFLTRSAAGAAALAVPGWLRETAAHAASAAVLDRLGVALYTVRDQMKTDAAGTLKAIGQLGYRYIESGLRPSLEAPAKAAGLQQKSAYAPTYLVTGNRKAWSGMGEPLLPEDYTWQSAVDEAKARGLEYLVVVYLVKAERGGIDVYRDLAAKMTKAGEACKKAGLGLAYHAHAFEFEPIGGVRPIDVLLETPKDLVGLELDTFWASIAGADPVQMVQKHAGRVPLVHLKDKARGTPVQYDEGRVPHEAFKEIGQGEIDYARFFPAAQKAGVKYYYVEQDYTTATKDPLASLKMSREAIAKA